MNAEIEKEIEEMVHRETRAWETKDLDLLMTLFHPDMVWPWPRTPESFDPMDWVLELGRFVGFATPSSGGAFRTRPGCRPPC